MKEIIKVPVSSVFLVWAIGIIAAIYFSTTKYEFFTIATGAIGLGLSALMIVGLIYNMSKAKDPSSPEQKVSE